MAAPQTEVVITVAGSETGRFVLTPGDYVIGRNEDCPIRVDADLVSRQHAKLILNYDHALIEDLGSSSGTKVNGQPIAKAERTRLWPNQKIQVGTATIELRRLKVEVSDMSLAPAQAMVRRVLPEEFLRAKKYDIGGVVARGGMGAILDAREATTERTIAMKVMLDSNDPDALLRFLNEAKITAQLEHPNIVPVHELSVDENGQPYYTMKMVRGITLKKVLELMAAECGSGVPPESSEPTGGTPVPLSKKYPLPALLTIFQKVCDALAFAHSRGVIHRDLKPENIMLGDYGEALVMDWGLAKKTKGEGAGSEEDATPPSDDIHTIRHTVAGQMSASPEIEPSSLASTMAGTVMGTPHFMSPEQARGEVDTLDARSDIWSLGAILYQVLSLRVPVTGRDAWEIVGKVARGEIEPLQGEGAPSPRGSANSGRGRPGSLRIPDSLAAVVRKAMSLDRAARYATVADFQRDIAAYQTGFATGAENAGAWKQFTLFVKRNKAAPIGVAAVLLVGSVLGTKAIIEGKRAERGEALAKAETHRANQALGRAESTLHELRGTAPTFVAQARALVDEGRLDEALEKISYATDLDPQNPDHHLQRAGYLQALQRLDEAGAEYREVLARRPDDPDAQTNLALCQRLRAESGGANPLPREQQQQLFDALLAQERMLEAIPLGRAVGDSLSTAQAELMARLKPYIAQERWKAQRFRRTSDGTFKLDLTGLVLGDLSELQSFPISRLDLIGTKLTEIPSLSRLPLRWLGLNNNPITDLSPLRGLNLRFLSIDGCKVKDLGPLAGMPLEELHISTNYLANLEPLRGMRLRVLQAKANKIRDLEPLTGMPLEEVDLGGNPFESLEPLRGAPLKSLQVGGIPKASDASFFLAFPTLEEIALPYVAFNVEPLRQLPALKRIAISGIQKQPIPAAEFWAAYQPDWCAPGIVRQRLEQAGVKLGSKSNHVSRMPDGTLDMVLGISNLERLDFFDGFRVSKLDIGFTKVRDLALLRGHPLTWLRINSTPVTDLRPLLDCPTLEILCLPRQAQNVEVLKQLPKLRRLSYDWDVASNQPAQTAEEFWKEYDAKK